MTHGEPKTFENAVLMLDTYKAELLKNGLEEQALQLKGLELFAESDAKVALMTLESFPPVSEEADALKRYVIQTIRELLEPVEQRLAS